MKDQKWPARRSRLKSAIYLNKKFKSSAIPKGRTVVRRQGRSTELRPSQNPQHRVSLVLCASQLYRERVVSLLWKKVQELI